ncbi:MAG: Rod shape-determining protein RodA [Parcubacteria group bacterium GW2011_GWD2_38_12]|nr:MAG: Rod shape-determining protein RodA [Parcubacteria group bacterium GW2011_GWC2_36_17]KKQ43277.1 MAG: Rod shape-determining protein RodA [Parcubacteria group bacterium GW2011_GWE2_37_8]KKQ51550.1 MAG: Rod shape-determining protein RodA [Parcubacteria group bacterium GW2011_GWD2_38_12]KKQ58270.1 MAG: Rod shape-determining protein RodA [Parcubacteria group bacterium GW2011_GWC1_38_17]KKQ59181.1 MAG: Rod shape-determining protein RodA [Parcubacteria group bacterium GW2011_GWD1_38_16]
MLRNHFKNFDWWLFSAVVFLVFIGILMFFAGAKYGAGDIYLKKQLFFLIFGIILIFGISFFDYRRLKAHSAPVILIYALSIAALILVLMFGVKVRGSISWFKIGPFSVEPVEFVKIAILALFAKFFTLRHAEIYRLSHIVLSAVYVAIPTLLVFLQPDFGSAILLIGIWVGMMMISGINKKYLATLFFIGAIFFSVAWFGIFKDYQKDRIFSFLNPLEDPYGAGYNIIQSRIAIGSGGLLGMGLGRGTQTRLGFLPEAHTDFIFAAIAEELGLLGVVFIFVGYGFIFWRILKIANWASNNFAKLFCFGFLILISLQFIINISMNLGVAPVTGITLPFISYGGSSLISLFIGLGIIESIAIRNFKTANQEI